jgi:hypothetical protein
MRPLLVGLIACLLVFTARASAIDFHPPAGWETNDLTGLPPELHSAKKSHSPDEGIEVTLIETKVAASATEMEAMMRGQLSGMEKKGFVLQESEEITIHGFPARHLRGEFRSPEFEGAYLVDSYTFFSDAATITLSISIDDAKGGRELGADVLKWLTIPGAPLAFNAAAPESSSAYSIGEMIGRGLVYAVFGLALLQFIRHQVAKRRKTAEKPAQE